MKKTYIILAVAAFTVNTAFAQWTTSGNDIYNNNSGNVGIGTTSPAFKLHVVNGSYAFSIANSGMVDIVAPLFQQLRISNTTADATNKIGYITGRHITNSQPDVLGLLINSNTDLNHVSFGGGSSGLNAATALRFYTAVNATTLTGTEQMRMYSTGNLQLGGTMGADNGYRLDLQGSARVLGSVTLGSASTGLTFYNTTDQITNFERVRHYWSGNVYNIATDAGGTGSIRAINFLATNGVVSSSYSINFGGSIKHQWLASTSVADFTGYSFGGAFFPSSGYSNIISVSPTFTQTGTAGYRALFITPYESTTGSGNKFLIDAGTNTAANGTGTHTSKFVLTSAGNVGIGTTTPHELLSVNGNIRSKQIKVEVANWPDYVFDKDYQLPSLADVKAYIDKNQHLSGIPSAEEIAKDGLNLGEMNKQVVKKLEELTLYVIDQKETIKEQQEQINQLRQQLNYITGYLNKTSK